MAEDKTTKPRVLIVGGGIAGLEAALALADLAPGLAEVTLIAPDPAFHYKPLVVEEPFTSQPAEQHELAPLLAAIEVGFVSGALARVVPEQHKIELADGAELEYDRLLVCVGGRARPAYRSGETFWSSSGDLPVDDLIAAAASSESPTLGLVVPPGTSWPLPLYEVALMLRRRAEELGHGEVELCLYTPEEAPLKVFGVPASEAVAETLAARRIEVVTATQVVETPSGALQTRPGGEALELAAMVALPTIVGPRIDGLPADEEGFIVIDEYCRASGAEGVFAAGDGTTFPVKQGGIATQQADCAAEQVAAWLGAPVQPQPFDPVLRGRLLTGMESLNLRHGLTGGEGEGVASLDYLWWPPRKVAGRYLAPWLSGLSPQEELEPPVRPLEVEVSVPHEWHALPGSYDAEIPG